jgi:hypothetical protein
MGVRSRNETAIRGPSQTHVGIASGSREDIILKRKRAHGVIVSNDEPAQHVIIKKRRQPSLAVVGEIGRTVTRRHVGSDVNERTGVRSRETSTVNRRESSVSGTSRGSLHSQSSGQTRGTGSGGNQGAGNAGSTTGQGNSR